MLETRSGRLAPLPALAGLVLLGMLYLACLWPQLDRPLIYDDVNFAFAAEAVARTGLPFANAGHMSDRWDFSQREQWALWHPPLYIQLLGLQFKIFGVSERSGRLLGVAFGLGTAALVFLTGLALGRGGPRAGLATGLLAAALFLLSPLTMQSALILDIDGTVLTFLLALLVYILVRFPPERYPLSLPILSGLFALSLWAKMTTPLGLLGCLLVVRLLAGRLRQGLRELVVIGVGGGALFLGTWWLACALLRMPFEMPFAVTWIELVDASDASRAWLRSPLAFVRTVGLPLLWAGPYLVPLFAACGLARLRGYALTWKVQPVDLLIGFGTLIYLVYLIKLAGGFPKYHIAMMPFWAVAVAVLVVEALASLRVHEAILAAASIALFAWYTSASVPDVWIFGPVEQVTTQVVVIPGLLATGLLALLYLIGGCGVGRGLALALVVMSLGWGIGLEQRFGRASGSTTYFYGTQGQREAAALVDALTRPDEFYAAAKEVAWYARNQHYVDQDTLDYFIRLAGGRFDGRLLGYDIRVLALWQQPDFVKAFYQEALSAGYNLESERGDYAIWVRRGP